MDRQEELAAKLETYLAHEVLAPAPVSDPFDEAADRASRTLAEIGTFAAKTLSGRSVPRLALVDLVGRGHVRIRSLPWPLNGLLVDERGSGGRQSDRLVQPAADGVTIVFGYGAPTKLLPWEDPPSEYPFGLVETVMPVSITKPVMTGLNEYWVFNGFHPTSDGRLIWCYGDPASYGEHQIRTYLDDHVARALAGLLESRA